MLARFLNGLFKVFTREKTGYTRRNFWGHSVRYNKEGQKVGWSRKNFWGGRNRYNANDELTSYTLKNFWGGYNTYDPDGNLIKKSYKNAWGGHNTYNLDGDLEQQTVKNIWKGVDIYEGEPTAEVTPAKRKVVKEQSSTPKSEPSRTVNAIPATQSTRSYTSPNVERKPVEEAGLASNQELVMPSHKIDKTISYFASIQEAVQYYGIAENHVKVLAFTWLAYEEVPALAYLRDNEVNVVPLIKNVERLSFPISGLENIEKEVKADVSFEDMERCFWGIGISNLGTYYESLFPEYCFNGMDGSIDMYKLPCGLVITEKSVENLRGLV